jgi:hypothetical protein
MGSCHGCQISNVIITKSYTKLFLASFRKRLKFEFVLIAKGPFARSKIALMVYTVVWLIYRVYQKSLNGVARLYLRNPWDYINGMGAKRCASSLSLCGNLKILII